MWKHFQAICDIPHPSHHEELIREHVIGFAEANGLDHQMDEVGNIIIRKPATAGMEDRVGVVFQAHLDMVPQKNPDVEHDFTKDPIKAFVDPARVDMKHSITGAHSPNERIKVSVVASFWELTKATIKAIPEAYTHWISRCY